jgi:hypothetical protein
VMCIAHVNKLACFAFVNLSSVTGACPNYKFVRDEEKLYFFHDFFWVLSALFLALYRNILIYFLHGRNLYK